MKRTKKVKGIQYAVGYGFSVKRVTMLYGARTVRVAIKMATHMRAGSACNYCGTTEWAAKNDRYCSSCEREWWLEQAM